MRLDSVFPFLPTGFTLHFVGSMIACASIFFISRFFSPLLVPQYNNLSPSQKLLWCTSGVRLYGNFMVYLFISKEVPRWVDYFVNAGFGPYDDLLYMESSKVFAHALGISLGYMAFDLILQVCLWKYRCMLDGITEESAEGKLETSKPCAVKHSLSGTVVGTATMQYWQSMFHHVVSLVCWTYAITFNRCIVYLVYLMCTETTGIFFNSCLLLQMIQYNGIIKNILGALFVASFTVIRIIPIPLVAWVLFTASYDKMLFSEKVAAAATVPIPIFMNIYCYSLMLRVARDRLKGLTTTTNAKKKA